MLYLLLILIVCLVILTYRITKDVLSPSLLLMGVFVLSVLCAIMGNNSWRVEFSEYGVFAIVGGLVFIFVGEVFSKSIVTSGNYVKIVPEWLNSRQNKNIPYSNVVMCILCLVCVYIVQTYYSEILRLALSYGYEPGEDNMLEVARWARHDMDFRVALISFAGRGLGWICLSIFVNNILLYKNVLIGIKNNILLIIPVATLVALNVLSTSRNGIIAILVVAFCLVFDRIRSVKQVNISKIAKWGLGLIIMFLLVFLVLGNMRGQIDDSGEGALDLIWVYAGSSIVALDVWLNKGTVLGSPERLFGKESFVGVHNFISRFDSSHPVPDLFSDFVVFPDGTRTNIYTGFQAWIADFGLVGFLILCFIVGLFYGAVYTKCVYSKHSRSTVLFKCIYGYLLYYLVYTFATPELTTSLLSVTQICDFAFIIFFYWLITTCNYKLKW